MNALGFVEFLVQGVYPNYLSVLAPQFIATVRSDVINGQPLNYRRLPNDRFLLYSVGWNEKDDGGKPGVRESRVYHFRTGGWVW